LRPIQQHNQAASVWTRNEAGESIGAQAQSPEQHILRHKSGPALRQRDHRRCTGSGGEGDLVVEVMSGVRQKGWSDDSPA